MLLASASRDVTSLALARRLSDTQPEYVSNDASTQQREQWWQSAWRGRSLAREVNSIVNLAL